MDAMRARTNCKGRDESHELFEQALDRPVATTSAFRAGFWD